MLGARLLVKNKGKIDTDQDNYMSIGRLICRYIDRLKVRYLYPFKTKLYFFQGIVWLKKYISIDLFICRNSLASREVSQEIRDEIDTLINEAAKDMLNHWTNTNRSLQVRIIARIYKWNIIFSLAQMSLQLHISKYMYVCMYNFK